MKKVLIFEGSLSYALKIRTIFVELLFSTQNGVIVGKLHCFLLFDGLNVRQREFIVIRAEGYLIVDCIGETKWEQFST